MAPIGPLGLLLRALQRIIVKPLRLVSRCRPLWTILWRLLQRCVWFLFERRFTIQASHNPSHRPIEDIDQRLRRAEGASSSLPVDRLQVRQSDRLSVSYSSRSGSSDIFLTVIPPVDDAPSITSSQFETRSSRGDLMTIHSENDMSSQTFQVLSSGANGSRASLVLPASPSLVPGGGDLGPGANRDNGLIQEIAEHIYPLMPYKVPRHKRRRFIEDKPVEFEISANQDELSPRDELPKGWKQVTHPGGQPYFYHAEKRIITECWIWDPHMFMILDCFIDQFEKFTWSRNVKQPNDVDLLLEVTVENDVNWCGYYYVSASTHSVFWLEPFDISCHVSGVRGDISPSHIKLYLEYQYWVHWDLFPNLKNVTDDTYDLVLNAIADARTDVQGSRISTVNQSKEDLKEMTDIVEVMQNRKASASHWCLGRFMQLLMRDRFINYHGQYGARLDPSQSIHSDEIHKRTWLIKIFSPLLLSAPNVHLQSLNVLWVDNITLKRRWVEFFVEMNEQWGEHIFHASILLNANVAFLAIPSNDPSNNSTMLLSARTGAQISSYLSIVTSFSSMMLGLMLVLKHRTKERHISGPKIKPAVEEYHRYLHAHVSQKFGFEGLAIMYSLPYALLAWGIGTFFIAFLIMCFVKSTATVRSIVAIATFLVCGLVLWCIWMFWQQTTFHFHGIISDMWNRLIAEGKDEEQDNFESSLNQEVVESRDVIAEANENHSNDNKGVLHRWMMCGKSWWGDWSRGAWLQGNAQPMVTCKNNEIPLSTV